MLFVARSPLFVQAAAEESAAVAWVHRAVRAAQRPWLVLTYLLPAPITCCWETACTQELDDLLAHMKDRPSAQLASLLYMAPPRFSVNNKWSRLRVDFIDMGKYQNASVNVYYIAGQGLRCLDHPEVDAADVRFRKRVISVDWFRHFND